MYFKKLEYCLVCNNNNLKEYVDIGLQPLVNNLKEDKSHEELKFPILVNECLKCSHKQLSIAVDKKILFSNYLYKTGSSNRHLEFFNDFVESIEEYRNQSVLDIGCNDASLLKAFKRHGWKTLGIDSASNITKDVEGIEVINDFFPSNKIEGKFDCITAFNVFAHNDNPLDFLCAMKRHLKESGRIYILTTVARLDNYYHEHISYFNPLSMNTLAYYCGLELVSFKETTMHERSYLFELKHKQEEKVKLIQTFWNEPPLVGFGAAASGIVLLNYLEVFPEYVVDDNELKQGKYIPGVNVPIYEPNRLYEDNRDLNILILANHLFDEIRSKIEAQRPNRKDKFIHPIKGIIK